MLSILKGRKKVLLALTGAPYAGMSHTTFYFPLTKCAVQIHNRKNTHIFVVMTKPHELYNVQNTKMSK